jgi:Zn-dependent oligopeptidase
MRSVFREAEKRRWQEIDNSVKKINGFKPEPIKEDEFSFIFNHIFSSCKTMGGRE